MIAIIFSIVSSIVLIGIGWFYISRGLMRVNSLERNIQAINDVLNEAWERIYDLEQNGDRITLQFPKQKGK